MATLKTVCRERGQNLHVVFDTYSDEDLKAQERQMRGASQEVFKITGRDQAPRKPSDTLMKNTSFKNELSKFLMMEWQREEYREVVGRRKLFVSYGGVL